MTKRQKTPCELEPEVLAAWAPGGDDGELRRDLEPHLRDCPTCRRTAHLSRALGLLAAADPGVELPDPRRMFWRARVLRRFADRQLAQRRAARPVNAVRWIAVAATVAVAALVAGRTLLSAADGLGGWMQALAEAPWAVEVLGATDVPTALVAWTLWLGVGLLACALAFGVYALAEEA